ncbi:MAG: Phosphoglucosamine mutase [Chlamydiales bacterium]|nr:Phosphoglucosamine mutase [Chlamydiales bacterium]MCH9635565.1 Phosphoglucosamine mutase [Chlamydiales bacterium]MCH9703395.1 phosphoglucosamine mutase [Chlamydiota bacterium]
MEKLFGTDGVRGHANHFPTTVEIALALGRALASVLHKKGGKKRVVIGKDTRLSGYMFENALIAGLNSMGVDTLMTGPVPTPAIAYLTRAYRADAGVMISASHNPFYDNGIKIFGPDGFKLPDEVEAEIEGLVSKQSFEFPGDRNLGRNKRIDDADGRYIEFAKATFLKNETLRGLPIVLDCANGAAHRVGPATFWELHGQVTVLGDRPDGCNINEQVGSLFPQKMQAAVIEKQAAVGIALDGDADRVVMADERGQLVDGDIILAISAKWLQKMGRLKNSRVVVTVMTNLGVIEHLKREGIEVFTSKVGDRHVLEMMQKKGAMLGGEQSGHMIFLEHNTTGDGIVSALQVLQVMQSQGKKLSELAAGIELYPQVLVNVPVKKKPPLESLSSLQQAISDVQGRCLVRYSGTENLCRILVEGKEASLVRSSAKAIEAIVQEEIGGCVESLAT